jgi:hypothetical protein
MALDKQVILKVMDGICADPQHEPKCDQNSPPGSVRKEDRYREDENKHTGDDPKTQG